MKILSSEQIHGLDKYTIENEPVTSVDLMERAASKFAGAVSTIIKKEQQLEIFCGMGNNGGDGLAIARMLLKSGFRVNIYVVKHSANGSPDFEVNETRLRDMATINYIEAENQIPVMASSAVCIDAILGSGVSRPVDGIAATVIRAINRAGITVYSVDLPSGLFCDALNNESNAVIQSTITFTFHAPKLAFLFPQNEKYVPEFKILDIGLSKQYEGQLFTRYEYVDDQWIRSVFRKRKKFSHKGTFGHALICAGEYGKMGAAVLCTAGALKSGAGLVTTHIPNCGYQIMQISNPEAMVVTDANEGMLTQPLDYAKFSAIGIGPGIGMHDKTADLVENLLRRSPVPIVLDADALNIIAKYRPLKGLLSHNTVITPHPGEFKRIVGDWRDDMQKIQKQVELSKQQRTVIVLKGAHTSVSNADGKIYFNSTGNPGMAKGGTGDVLTGIITALLAQGYPADIASVMGVYIHGKAGDAAASALGQTGITARDIINYLPVAFAGYEV